MNVAALMCPPAVQEDYDGTILPTDFKASGQIRDTELARVLVHTLPPGVVLHALFDSCHSGEGVFGCADIVSDTLQPCVLHLCVFITVSSKTQLQPSCAGFHT
jgi:hypothetical protein